MKQFTLPKKFETTGRGVPFFYNDEYISNGKFLIKKCLIKDTYKYCMPTTINMPNLTQVVPTELPTHKFIKTVHLLRSEGSVRYIRIFECAETGVKSGSNEDFVEHFGLTELYGSYYDHVFCNQDISIVIMPCRHAFLSQGDK